MSVKKSRCFEFSQPLTDRLPMKLLFSNRLLSPHEKTPFFILHFAVFVLNFCNRSEKFVTWENFVFYNMPSLNRSVALLVGYTFNDEFQKLSFFTKIVGERFVFCFLTVLFVLVVFFAAFNFRCWFFQRVFTTLRRGACNLVFHRRRYRRALLLLLFRLLFAKSLVSSLPRKTTNLSYKNSVTKFITIVTASTMYSFT